MGTLSLMNDIDGEYVVRLEDNMMLLCELGEYLQHAISAVRLVERELRVAQHLDECSKLRAAITSMQHAGRLRAAILGVDPVVVVCRNTRDNVALQ
jgi:hypothetical protein